ncbi:type VI secretion system baseplate subunit TssG [Paraburkholderia nodosa]|uniref:type VI secretion system baseplate subunit TssG n=1 Tax=Paraburkholderia nodosa TaxID=392320 RepID=UPI0009F6A56C|nr:type VI secretion system baseplate subunit TssG [Paraburkholderia nodosa]
MSTWPEDSRSLERLLAEPWRTEFFQTARLLERWFVGHGRARQQDAVPDRITFRTTLSTTLPPSEIEQIVSFNAAGERLGDKQQRAAADVFRVDVTPAFFGLLGSQGALPLRYTEQITREHRDPRAEYPPVRPDMERGRCVQRRVARQAACVCAQGL